MKNNASLLTGQHYGLSAILFSFSSSWGLPGQTVNTSCEAKFKDNAVTRVSPTLISSQPLPVLRDAWSVVHPVATPMMPVRGINFSGQKAEPEGCGRSPRGSIYRSSKSN